MDLEHIDSEPIIQIKNLTKTFFIKGANVTAIDDFSLDIHKGDIYGIIGMSGAGKSTLVRCINALETPTSGTVIFDGIDLSQQSGRKLRHLRRAMSMIFQQFNLLAQRNVLSNVCFPLEIGGVPRKEARRKARELLALVGLSEKEKSYPSQLSGGQKQRVAIARALATDPKVLLCDEATSALDPTTTGSILALLKDIHQRLGITIVIITHEMSVIEKICSHVAVMEHGRIAEMGRVEDIFSEPKSSAARKLVYPDEGKRNNYIGERCIRVVFDGSSSNAPVFSNMVRECNATVNIWFADLKDIQGKAFGHMIVELPDDALQAEKITNYLRANNIKVEDASE
ncbi:MAG: ATP-binding cassette domain-containing protein [Oscillospiraceae bacterium]|nr:ATP-binding cassette domain-containing protein [Oscillospiraceae bacterium]